MKDRLQNIAGARYEIGEGNHLAGDGWRKEAWTRLAIWEGGGYLAGCTGPHHLPDDPSLS